MNRSRSLWLAAGAGLALASFSWTLATQPSPFLPVLVVLAWSGVIRWGTQHAELHRLQPSPVSLLLGMAVAGGVVGVMHLSRPTSLAYALPLGVGLAMALTALPLKQFRQVVQPLVLLMIPLLPLVLRGLLPESLLAPATAAVSALLLQLLGVEALGLGQHLLIGDSGVRVAGACGGTEDIAFLVAIALLLAITQPPRVGRRLGALLLLAPVLGFVTNAMRVAVLAVVVQQGGWWRQQVFPSLHEGYGSLFFSVGAVVALLGVDGVLRPSCTPRS